MTFAAPFWLALAGVLAALVAAMHFLARRHVRPLVFPTARFIPDLPASAAAPAHRPSDLLLLLLRLAIILLLGLALARPMWPPPRRIVRLVALDRSRAAAPTVDRASRATLARADLVIVFDSAAWPGSRRILDTIPLPTRARGSLSAVILAALRALPRYAGRGDSMELAIISPFAAEEWDGATMPIRRLWRGGITLGFTRPADSARVTGGAWHAAKDDPLAATISLLGTSFLASTRIRRRAPNPDDSAWARAGGALIYWPEDPVASRWASARPDTVPGVAAADHAVVAPFPRSASPPAGRVIARWIDGTPAATERQLGGGCERDVAIEVPSVGDLVLRPSMLDFTRTLLAPCGGRGDLARVSIARLDSLRGPSGLLPTSRVPPESAARMPASGWLLLAALLLFGLEPLVRGRVSAV